MPGRSNPERPGIVGFGGAGQGDFGPDHGFRFGPGRVGYEGPLTIRSRDALQRPAKRQRGSTAVETKDLIDLLNDDLGTEYRSIVQYVQHIATIKGAEYQALIGELRKHVVQELDHAMALADQIDFLGGTPTVAVPTIPNEPDEAAALRLDLDLEEGQLKRYRQRIEQANEMNLPDVAEALRPLLSQTQDHVMDLRTALGK